MYTPQKSAEVHLVSQRAVPGAGLADSTPPKEDSTCAVSEPRTYANAPRNIEMRQSNQHEVSEAVEQDSKVGEFRAVDPS